MLVLNVTVLSLTNQVTKVCVKIDVSFLKNEDILKCSYRIETFHTSLKRAEWGRPYEIETCQKSFPGKLSDVLKDDPEFLKKIFQNNIYIIVKVFSRWVQKCIICHILTKYIAVIRGTVKALIYHDVQSITHFDGGMLKII